MGLDRPDSCPHVLTPDGCQAVRLSGLSGTVRLSGSCQVDTVRLSGPGLKQKKRVRPGREAHGIPGVLVKGGDIQRAAAPRAF